MQHVDFVAQHMHAVNGTYRGHRYGGDNPCYADMLQILYRSLKRRPASQAIRHQDDHVILQHIDVKDTTVTQQLVDAVGLLPFLVIQVAMEFAVVFFEFIFTEAVVINELAIRVDGAEQLLLARYLDSFGQQQGQDTVQIDGDTFAYHHTAVRQCQDDTVLIAVRGQLGCQSLSCFCAVIKIHKYYPVYQDSRPAPYRIMFNMRYYLVAPTVQVHAQHTMLTYHAEQPFQLGAIVKVPLGKRSATAVIVREVTTKPSFATKPIERQIIDRPLPASLVGLAGWIADYYGTHLAAVFSSLLPRGIEKTRRARKNSTSHPLRMRTQFVLNKDQQRTVERIVAVKSGTFLVRGVTGSGKTRVYIETIRRSVETGRSAIVLVPEIALTSQLVAEFSAHFENLIVTHSTMTEAERHLAWAQALNSTEPIVVIGPRSAIFSPVPNLGCIVVDEAHEPTYKQEQSPKYSALRVASKLGELAEAQVVFGSATPSIVDTYLARSHGKPELLLTKRAVEGATPAEVSVIDLTTRGHFTRHRFFSNDLITSIEQAVESGKQALLFHNRRGSAPLTLCEHCGWMAACPTCFMPLTLHTDVHQLLCHLCGHSENPPGACPDCGEPGVVHKGIGTKMIAEELTKLFPKAVIARFDGDTATTEQLHTRYQDIYDGKVQIIVGTQVVAKGLDLPKLTVVGVVQADGGLSLPDYQSTERVFQLIYQVSGRVGRGIDPTKVIVQTYQPTHPSVTFGVAQDYDGFYEYAIKERKRALFPPFTHLLKLTCVYKTESSAIKAATALAADIRAQFGAHATVFGPAPSFYERLGGTYRWQVVVKAPARAALLEIIKIVPPQRWQIDLDPANLL